MFTIHKLGIDVNKHDAKTKYLFVAHVLVGWQSWGKKGQTKQLWIVSNHDNPRELKTKIKQLKGAIFSQFRAWIESLLPHTNLLLVQLKFINRLRNVVWFKLSIHDRPYMI